MEQHLVIVQIDESEWGEILNPEYLAILPLTAKEIEREFNVTTFEYWDDGLGLAKSCVVAVDDSKYWLKSHPVEGESDANFMSVEIRSFEPNSKIALDRLLTALGIVKENLVHCREDLGPAGWILSRLDDNGNELEMFRFHNERVAKWLRDEYERKGHKQSYFVRNVT